MRQLWIPSVPTLDSRDGTSNLKIRKLAKDMKSLKAQRRCVYRINSILSTDAISVHDNYLSDVISSITRRVLFVPQKDGTLKNPPKPIQGVFSKLKRFEKKVVHYITTAYPNLRPLSFDEFIALCPSDKRKRYTAAKGSMFWNAVRIHDSYIKFFVKAEKTNFTKKPQAVPRAIQPRSPRYCLAVGIYMKHIEHLIYEAIAHVMKEVTVTKGLNADQTGQLVKRKWTKFSNPIAVGWDAERFDEHVSYDCLSFEHGLYIALWKALGVNTKELNKLLRWQKNNKGTAYTKDGYKVSYTVRGGRMSGDMNTALGNCYLMCAMTWYIMKKCKVSKYELLNNGDDCVLIIEKAELYRLDGLVGLFKDFGFSMKLEKEVENIEDIVFCQAQPIFIDGTYRMVRQLQTGLEKDLTLMCQKLTRKDYDSWRNAVALGGMALCSGIPVFQAFYRWMGRDTSTRKANPFIGGLISSGFYRMSKGMKGINVEVSMTTRMSFWKAFGITPDKQIWVETYLEAAGHEYCNEGPVEISGFNKESLIFRVLQQTLNRPILFKW